MGYGTKQLLVQMKEILPDYSPDYIIIFTGWNCLGSLADPYEFTLPIVYSPHYSLFEGLDKIFQNNW